MARASPNQHGFLYQAEAGHRCLAAGLRQYIEAGHRCLAAGLRQYI